MPWEVDVELGSAFICKVLAPVGFSASRRVMQRAVAEDELFK